MNSQAQNQSQVKSKGVDYWTQRISDLEMPALCSTVKKLEKLAKDDVSSLRELGKSVMHDNALTSRILRVANSVTYNKGQSQVTTVSRATVVLGFDTVRNICITAKLLSSLLESKGLSESVYRRLIKLMARAFHAAMLAKMMLKDYDEESQEEAFIASLLYHLGESAFWSTGCDEAVMLDVAIEKCNDNQEKKVVIQDALGTSFNQLSSGIARSWGLGYVLLKSLTHPDDRTPEIRCIYLSNQLSELLAQDKPAPEELRFRLQQAASILNIEVDELRLRMVRCSQATKKLAEDFGAKVLIEHLPTLTHLQKDRVLELDTPSARMPNMNIQLKKLRELTDCAINKADFNRVITTTLEGLLDGVGVDLCGVLLLSPNRKRMQPRIALGEGADEMKREFIITLERSQCLFCHSIELKQAMFVDDPNSPKWRLYLDSAIRRHTSATGFMISPLVIEQKVIGMIYADRASSERQLTEEDFDHFIHFTQLANVCLTASMGQ